MFGLSQKAQPRSQPKSKVTQWVFYDGMPYDPIQSEGQGHRGLTVVKMADFNFDFHSASVYKTKRLTVNYYTLRQRHHMTFKLGWETNFGKQILWRSCNQYETWYVVCAWWVMYSSMTFTQIQGQGHRGPKGAKMADFKVYLLHQYACNQKTVVNYECNWPRLTKKVTFEVDLY